MQEDEKYPPEDLRRYCDKSKCVNFPKECETDSLCLGSLKRKLPITPPEVPT